MVIVPVHCCTVCSLRTCLVPSLILLLYTDLKQKHDPLPHKMLALMSVLESDGPSFAQKMAITLTSGQDRGLVYQVNNTNSLLHVIQYVLWLYVFCV